MATRPMAMKQGVAYGTAEEQAPIGLREVLETSRLSLLALFRTLDRLHLVQTLPPELRILFELDADLAEALWALDQPIGCLDVTVMSHDTVGSLAAIPDALSALFALLSAPEQAQLAFAVKAVRASLCPSDAYLQIPGRDPPRAE
jgi:hypothetical protein